MKDNKRIIFKLSGEALSVNGHGFDYPSFLEAAKTIRAVHEQGYAIAVVPGGGNVWRGRRGDALAMGAVAADQMGMLATLQNCLMLADALESIGQKVTVMSAVDVHRFAQPFNAAKARALLDAGEILLLGGGTGNPFCSTDTAVALRALELGCSSILMAKNVDGVYDKDPTHHDSAQLICDMSYQECLERDLRAIDLSALILLKDNDFPCVRIFKLDAKGENLLKVLEGDDMGTTMHP